MAKEIEIKILDIHVEEILKKLTKLGAKRVSDDVQRILTYDFRSISSEYQSALYDLNRKISDKICNQALCRLKQLFFDLDDLINEKDNDGQDRETLNEVLGDSSLSNFIDSNIELEEKIVKLNNESLLNIIEKYNINPNKWIRLRKTGNKTTITIKHILNRKTNVNGVREHAISDVLEYEIFIDDFDKGKEILELLGYYHKNYQEKRRIAYVLEGIEIDIDYWPHIPAYMEIEGESAEDVYEMLQKLGYKREDAKIMNADDVYTFYGLDMYAYKDLKF